PVTSAPSRTTIGPLPPSSSAVGARIARRAAGKHLLLELGGNGPIVVLDGADVTGAIEAAGHAAFWNAGQSCAAAERIIAEPGAYDEVVAGLTDYARGVRVGEPWLNTTFMGPVNNAGVSEKMSQHIEDAVGRGGVVTFGGVPIGGMPSNLYL